MNRVESWGGAFYVGTSLTTLNGKGENLKVDAFVAQEDTVITILEGRDNNNNLVDFLDLFGLNISSPSPTIKQGALFTTENGWYITTIKLASGSIIVYS
jgi:hypothetical protein